MDHQRSVVQLGRMLAEGRHDEASALLRRELPRIARDRPDLGDEVRRALHGLTSPARSASRAELVPSDQDSRLQLARIDARPVLPLEPVWATEVELALRGLLLERQRADELVGVGLHPTRTALFLGPPGVGKTLAANWLAREMGKPLVTLDLAAVMSSLLGRTGNNIRHVLDFAKERGAVLLLDEFDSVAKRRDDNGEVGELKRLVNVLLQAIDDWSSDSLLIAATNHAELLDPAVWRRFECVVRFPLAGTEESSAIVDQLVGSEVSTEARRIAAIAFAGRGLAEASREIGAAKRDAIIRGIPIEESLLSRVQGQLRESDLEERLIIARGMAKRGQTQRKISEATGVSRDTLRVHGIAVSKGPRAARKGALNGD